MGRVLSIEKSGTPECVYDPACSYPHAYISEGFVSHNCVVLLDEVEKVFVTDSDNGVAQRMMGQLLWWLSEHRSQVLTVMTTNDKAKIPPELFREGRVDQTLVIPPMTGSQALQLSQAYLKLLLGDKLTLKQVTCVAFSKDGQFTPVEVLQLVARTIKANGWGLP
jgi:hypothetical protein